MTPVRIGLLNYADVLNFGDVLFPLLAERELQARLPKASFAFISPSGAEVAGRKAVRYDRAMLEDHDALLMCGGELVHRFDAMLSGIYERFGLGAIAQPTDLVFGWTRTPGPFKAWVGLGVPAPTPEAGAAIGAALPGLDFVAARGSRSRARLEACGAAGGSVRQCRDIGWLFPRLLRGRPAPPPPAGGKPYLAVQAFTIPDPDALARRLEAVAGRLGVAIVLVPLTTCWADEASLERLRQASGGAFAVVDYRMDVLDKLAILGGAAGYIGQSMHGFIGAAAQGRPAGIWAADGDDKFAELLGDAGLGDLRTGDAAGIERLAGQIFAAGGARFLAAAAEAEANVDALFDALAAAIASHGPRRHG